MMPGLHRARAASRTLASLPVMSAEPPTSLYARSPKAGEDANQEHPVLEAVSLRLTGPYVSLADDEDDEVA